MVDVIKKQGVRENTQGLNTGSGVYEALDREVKRLLDAAVERAEDNGRRTVKARDI